MGNFDRGGNRGGFKGGNDRGGRSNFQKKSWGGNDRSFGKNERAEMHKATCSECSKICEVPFRPSNDKPVYCNDCFSSKREGVDRKPRGDFSDRAPRREFDRPAQRPEIARVQPVNDEMKNQLRDLNSKMDRLITAMEKMTNTSAPKVANAPIVKVAPVVAKPTEIKKVTASKPVAKKVVAKKALAKKVVTKKKK